ncbi:MAG: hypothetical protein LUI87_10785 [Lachnospiraceae bacterium]|nr:hypothetical protein [Lachnospiraceae bacterium]
MVNTVVEIKIKMDDIDYANIIKVAFPVVKKKAETETAMWATVVRHINEPDESTIEGLLKLIPESVRDMLVEAALEKYKEEIPAVLTSLAESKGLTLNVTDVEISIR